jgi:hypothetical protein
MEWKFSHSDTTEPFQTETKKLLDFQTKINYTGTRCKKIMYQNENRQLRQISGYHKSVPAVNLFLWCLIPRWHLAMRQSAVWHVLCIYARSKPLIFLQDLCLVSEQDWYEFCYAIVVPGVG